MKTITTQGLELNRETLRRVIQEAKPRSPKLIDDPVELKHGWLLPYLLAADQFLWRRWGHWFETKAAGQVIAAIPQIQWQKDQAAFKMVEHCLSNVTQYGDWRGWGSLSVFEFFLDWLLFGFGYSGQLHLPDEPQDCKGASERLYQVFNLETLLAYPYDYFGDVLAENRFGRESGFFPTPMEVSQLLAAMTFGAEDARAKTMCDPCVGTGRLLLAASNYSYRLYGTDINQTVIKACLVNGYLYAPWLVRPFQFLETGPEDRERKPEPNEQRHTKLDCQQCLLLEI